MTDLDRYRDLFVEEAREHLTALTEGILPLADGVAAADVDALFRAAHSIKGSAATVGLDGIAALAHALEDHLDRIRQDKRADEATVDLLVAATDALAAAVDSVAMRHPVTGTEAATERLRAALPPGGGPAAASGGTPPATTTGLAARYDALDPGTRLLVRVDISADCIAPRARLMVAERAITRVGRLVATDPPQDNWRELTPRTAHSAWFLLTSEAAGAEVAERLGGIPDVAACAVVAEKAEAAPRQARADTAMQAPASLGLQTSPTVRVRAEEIDRLVGMMGEVRIAQARLDRRLRELVSDDLPYPVTDILHQIELGVRGLYQDLLDIRTVSVAILLDRFPRFARELARTLGKEVEIVLEGRETTLDRSVIEVLADPLMHLVKNALDHGIETPEERRLKGKPARGTIRIAVRRDPAAVQVVFEDDGRGIDLEAVRAKAVARGMLGADDAPDLGPDETLLLLTTPGFSTAQEVTEVSGRGVGLDVVKTGIERVGGSMRLSSEPGSGTTIRVTLPPTLAVLEALEVECDGEQWFLPIDSVATSLTVSADDVAAGALVPPSGPDDRSTHSLLWARSGVPERPIPLVPLVRVLGLDDRPRYVPTARAAPRFLRAKDERERAPVTEPSLGHQAVVVERHGARLALLVDRIGPIREVVVKHLSVPGGEPPLVSGATITSDGEVALILDAAATLHKARSSPTAA